MTLDSSIDSVLDSSISAIQDPESSTADGSLTRDGGAHPSRSTVSKRDVCVFWLEDNAYALDVALVGEVISLGKITPVPLPPDGVLGLHNLRGSALPIIDLATILNLPSDIAANPAVENSTALVLRLPGDLMVGVLIDRIEAVVAWSHTELKRSKVLGEHVAIRGILQLKRRDNLLATLLNGMELTRRLELLKFQREDDAPAG